MTSLLELADAFDVISKKLREQSLDSGKVKAAILSAAQYGIKGLQSALGVDVDGLFGPISTRALEDVDVGTLIDALISIGGSQPPVLPVSVPTPIPVPLPTFPPEPIPTPSPPSAIIPHSAEYEQYFANMTIDESRLSEIRLISHRIQQNKDRYALVAQAVGVTYWPLIGVIHNMESSGNFNTHLYNGDPLTARTVRHPIGRPVDGNPPFPWEISAADALIYEGFNKWHDWSIVGMSYMLEKYNGFGYRSHDTPSPYLWAGSSIYIRGFYTSDGVFDPNAVSRQIGGMTMIKYFYNQGNIGV